MPILYNILQLLSITLFFPLLLIVVLSKKKLRRRIIPRLGIGLKKQFLGSVANKSATFWIHALSVGEVTSAVPLVSGIRKKYPESNIVISVSTNTGKDIAEKLLAPWADFIIDSPVDLLPVVYHYYTTIKPSIFILVETDFWPNTLFFLKKMRVPTLLVNGRISEHSMRNYTNFRSFFTPMFQNFSLLALQTELDRKNMLTLGIKPEKLLVPGNLKFDTNIGTDKRAASQELEPLIPENSIVFIAGSTHRGEEEIIITLYGRLQKDFPDLFLILVPRDPRRSKEIRDSARRHDMTISLRSGNNVIHHKQNNILLVDTIGELTLFYGLAHIAFVGGSLVKCGGHNPIEPAAAGLPVLFGPHMQDFSEISLALIQAEGAMVVKDADALQKQLNFLLESRGRRYERGRAALKFAQNQSGVVARHLDLIQGLL